MAYSIRETQQTCDSELFPDPLRFRPERWLGPSGERRALRGRARYQYIPFGLGARACVGQRLALLYQAVFVTEVARGCSYRLLNPAPDMQFIPVVRPTDDLPVEFTGRRRRPEERE